MENDFNKAKEKIKRELTDFLGVDAEDVEDDTSLTEDLHMQPTALSDFLDILTKAGFDVNSINLSEIDTFSELVEAVNSHV